jgi:hypothetical protein
MVTPFGFENRTRVLPMNKPSGYATRHSGGVVVAFKATNSTRANRTERPSCKRTMRRTNSVVSPSSSCLWSSR